MKKERNRLSSTSIYTINKVCPQLKKKNLMSLAFDVVVDDDGDDYNDEINDKN